MDEITYEAWEQVRPGLRRGPGSSGPDDRTAGSYAANREALDACRLNLRVLHGVQEPDTAVRILGMDLSMPVIGSPLTGAVCRLGDGPTETGFVLGQLSGCIAQGVVGCTGDGNPEDIFQAGLEALRRVDGKGLCFVKPWKGADLRRRIEQAEAAGAAAVGVDVDAIALAGPSHRDSALAPITPARLARIIRSTSLPFVVKGVMTPDEAALAVEAGAAGVVVSNRGGRVLDDCPGVAEVLPWVAEAVYGQAAILAEGGACCGGDVLKMLALGANAVMIGRPLEFAALGGGRRGVEEFLARVRRELELAMLMTGTPNASAVKRSVLYPRR